ncbi:MAG: hypothetical protein IKE25_05715 [Clostridia bacterium]|nr:hypothetical protein [Clostridia bacterium]
MNDGSRCVLEAVMDAINALEKARELLEDQETDAIAVTRESAVTIWHRCRCGGSINYGDRYCKECGRRIRW